MNPIPETLNVEDNINMIQKILLNEKDNFKKIFTLVSPICLSYINNISDQEMKNICLDIFDNIIKLINKINKET